MGNLFDPASITYTLANSGDTTLDWTATKTADWLDLSTASGTLDPGASTTLTISVNANADGLEVGTYGDTVELASNVTGGAAYLLPMTLEVAAPPEFIDYSFTQPLVFQMVVEAIPGTEIVIEASTGLLDWSAISTNQVAVGRDRELHRSRRRVCEPGGIGLGQCPDPASHSRAGVHPHHRPSPLTSSRFELQPFCFSHSRRSVRSEPRTRETAALTVMILRNVALLTSCPAGF